MTRLLSIDFSKSRTGIAFGEIGGKPVLSSRGFAAWEGASIAEVSSAVIRWLPDLVKVYQPEAVVLEAALPIMRSILSARIGLGASFMISGYFHLRGIRCTEADQSTWKALILGNGNLRKEEAKRRSMIVAKALGMEPRNDDEGDAGCIWTWYALKYHPRECGDMLKQLAMARAKWA